MTVQPDLNEITRAGLIVYWVSCIDLEHTWASSRPPRYVCLKLTNIASQVTFGIMIGSAACFAVMTWLRPYHDRKHGCELLFSELLPREVRRLAAIRLSKA